MVKHFSATARSSFAVSGLLAATMLLVTASAHAQDDERDRDRPQRGRLMLALDFDYASAIKHGEIAKGGGGALRIGTQRNLFLVTLIPELVLGYHNFDAHTLDRATIATGKLGGRIRFLKILEPGLFAHIGVGHVGGPEIFSHTGIAFDAGVTLDLTILPLIDLGLHAAWNRVFGGYDSNTTYATTGLHVALVL
jgi:hypothetical protein